MIEWIGVVYKVVAPCVLVAGVAIMLHRRRTKEDFSSLCPYFAIPAAISGLPLIYAYAMEGFISFYGANQFEVDAFHLRILSGPYWVVYWAVLLGYVLSQLFWIPRIRSSPVALVIIGVFLLIPIIA